MKLNRIHTGLIALGVALASAGAVRAQTPAAPTPAHHGAHAIHHGGGEHPTRPAMLLMHRGDLGLTADQVRKLEALRADDAAGAREVLTPEQRTRFAEMHVRMAAMGHGEKDCCDCCGDECCTGDCCKDPQRCAEACRDADCCKDARACAEHCTDGCKDMECCKGMKAGQHSAMRM